MDFNIAIKNREPKPRVINVKQYTNNADRVIFTFDPLPEQGDCYVICGEYSKKLTLEGNTAVWDISKDFTQRSGCFNFQLRIESQDKSLLWRSDLMQLIVSESLEGAGVPEPGATGGELKGVLILNGIIEDAIKGEADFDIIGGNPYGYVEIGLEYYLDGETANTAGDTGWQNLTTGIVYAFNGTENKTENSFVFDKKTYVSLPKISYPYLTVEVVFKPTISQSSEMCVIDTYESGGFGISLVNTNHPQFEVNIGSTYYKATSSTAVVNAICSCSGNFDGTRLLLSNNNVITITEQSGAINHSGYPLEIGRNSATTTSSGYFKGEIYCVRLYSRVLTAEEIRHNYEIDKARYGIEEAV